MLWGNDNAHLASTAWLTKWAMRVMRSADGQLDQMCCRRALPESSTPLQAPTTMYGNVVGTAGDVGLLAAQCAAHQIDPGAHVSGQVALIWVPLVMDV